MHPQQLNAELQDIASVGFTWIRTDIDWSEVQPNDAVHYDWAGYDAVVAAASAHHLHVLGVLAYTPTWARPYNCSDSPKCAPDKISDYVTFAKAAAARYGPRGVFDWEIWNEPNFGFWEPTPNATIYTTMLKMTYKAVKSVSSNAHIITGGLAPAADSANSIAPRTFLQQMYLNGARGYFDAVGDHPYSYPAPPDVLYDWSGWSQMADTPVSLRSIMQANGDGNKAIWITEFGAPTSGFGVAASLTDFRANLDAKYVDEQYQSAIAQQAIATYKTDTWAGPMFWYSYKDLGTSQDTNENFFGIVRADGTQKPLYNEFKKLFGH
jgi:hypothetical protein